MALGEWKDRIIIQKSVVGNDKAGNHILSWENYYTCHAYVNNLSGSEYWEAAQLNAEKEIFFLIRYCSEAAAIDTEHFRILFRGQVYNEAVSSSVSFQKGSAKWKIESTRSMQDSRLTKRTAFPSKVKSSFANTN